MIASHLRHPAAVNPSATTRQASSNTGERRPLSVRGSRFVIRLLAIGSLVFLAFAALAEPGQPAPPDDKIANKLGLTEDQVRHVIAHRGMSMASLQALPNKDLPRVMRRLSYADLPRERAAFRALRLRDESGKIKPGGRLKALEKLASLRRDNTKAKVAGIPTGKSVNPKHLQPLTAGAQPTGWTALGPGNIGGRTRSILIHPKNPKIIFAGSVAGGVWKSDDSGDSFYPVNDFMASLVISCMVMDPSNPDIIYAGTGEGFGNVDALRGSGIFRTDDGGSTWKQLQGTDAEAFQWVNRLAISSDGIVLLAATRSADTSNTGGIYLSQKPDRTDWVRKLAAEIADVKFDPTDSKKAVAGGLHDGSAFVTNDGGETWTPATHSGDWVGRVELAYARKDPTTVYASVDTSGGEMWRSTDGGKTYQQQNTGTQYLGDQGWYDNVIWADDPTNADLVLVGGVDLWKSTNGGKDLTDISTWWAENQSSAHADHHAIVAHPQFDGNTNKTVFFGNDGGIYVTQDVYTVGNDPSPPRTHGWSHLNHTYGVTQFYGAAANTTSGTIVGGAQDNGTLRFTTAGGPQKWSEMFGGDGGFCAAHPSDQNVFYGEYVYLNIHRSMDAGQSSDYISGQYWDGANWSWKPIPYLIPDAKNQAALFIAPFVLDPNKATRILAGGKSLWRTDDADTPNTSTKGPKWASIKNSVGSRISALAVTQTNSDAIWVGHENGQVYRTSNGMAASPSWVKVDQNGTTPLPNRYCTRLTIDPSDAKTIYVAFGGYSKGNIWKTTDLGQTWKSIGSALPEAPVYSVTVHPSKPNFVYAGTAVGIFASEDGGANWSPTNEGPTNCAVEELFWMNKTLVAVTHGRGLFRIDIP
jgi:photosystem II stability/assembly factor-like uncharacterized protein